MDKHTVRVVFLHGQSVPVDRHAQRVGVDGLHLIEIGIPGIRHQSAVVARGQFGRLFDRTVTLAAETSGTAVVEIIASAGPVRLKRQIVRRFLVRGDNQVVFRIHPGSGGIDSVQREHAVHGSPSDSPDGILVRNILCLNQFDRDVCIRVVRDHADRIAFDSGAFERDGEMRLLIHVKAVVFRAVSVKRAEVVRHLHGFIFDRIAEVGERQVRPGIHEKFGAVFRELSCRVEEFAPGRLTDFGGIETDHIVGKHRVEHREAAAVDRRRDHGAFHHMVEHDVVQCFRCLHQRPGNGCGVFLQRAQEGPEVAVGPVFIPIIVCRCKALANRDPVLPCESLCRLAERLERIAQRMVGGVEGSQS